jgi:glycosyltransferase involved in cell wall biosynthesis
MTTMRVIVDDLVSGGPGRLPRYADDLLRALLAASPRGADVAGFVAASTEDAYALIADRLPGLKLLHKSALTRGQLRAAWQRGFTPLPGSGVVHAPSLFVPLHKHDRSLSPGEQTVVTIHDAIAWTHPELLPSRVASWTRSMGARAERYADAVVVPTHAVAAELEEHLGLAGRMRVIGGAASTALDLPWDAAARRSELGLPDRYVVAAIEGDGRNGFARLAAASAGVPIVVLAEAGEAAVVEGADAFTLLEDLDDADRASVLGGAALLVQPSIAAGFGAPMLDAMSLGVPVVASDVPALRETADDAALLVGADDDLGEAIRGLLDDQEALDRLRTAGRDRAKAFTWRDAAEKIWQLHADL